MFTCKNMYGLPILNKICLCKQGNEMVVMVKRKIGSKLDLKVEERELALQE